MRWIFLSTVAALAAASLDAQAPPDALGRQVKIRYAGQPSVVLRGELIAAEADTLWLLAGDSLATVPRDDVSTIRVRQHGLTGARGLIWGVTGGIVTGALLTGACSSVADDCGGVFVSTFLTWMLVAGLSAPSLSNSAWPRVAVDADPPLHAYARFPQGWPAGLDRRTLSLGVVLALPPVP